MFCRTVLVTTVPKPAFIMELCPFAFLMTYSFAVSGLAVVIFRTWNTLFQPLWASKESAEKFAPSLVGLSLCVTLKVSGLSLCFEYLCFNYIMSGGFCFLFCVASSVVLFCVLWASCIGISLDFPRCWNFSAMMTWEMFYMPSAWDSFPSSYPYFMDVASVWCLKDLTCSFHLFSRM